MEKRIRDLIKKSMIEKNKNAITTYKNILETAQKNAKKTNAEVTDEMIISAIKTEMKQLNELLAFVKDGDEKHTEILDKLLYCETVLPKMASVHDIKEYLVTNSIEKNIGTCMRELKEHFGSTFDGKTASSVVKEYVNN